MKQTRSHKVEGLSVKWGTPEKTHEDPGSFSCWLQKKSQASRAHVSGAALDLEPWTPSPLPPSPGLLEAEPSCEPADCHENCPTALHASCR